ncbi:hypothetical protein EJ03DRAFT_354539 [Teratosphaeria nubilosa]|uniref:F-box domain-containing protein n=1 Tax=Teratosphaeria nubilosa TaxID=161662 RepID=A0A6G1L004_9PEZI|nr:hypothetical protein EJ03DRAFT_354539 [Teratosphaeria nubilosa]
MSTMGSHDHTELYSKTACPIRRLYTSLRSHFAGLLSGLTRALSGSITSHTVQDTTLFQSSLPDELWLVINSYLGPVERASLRQSCRKFVYFYLDEDVELVRAHPYYRAAWLRLFGRDWYARALRLEGTDNSSPRRRRALPAHLRGKAACAGCQTVHRDFALEAWEYEKDGTQRQSDEALHKRHAKVRHPPLFAPHHRLAELSHRRGAVALDPARATPADDAAPCVGLGALVSTCGMEYWFEPDEVQEGESWDSDGWVALKTERWLRWPSVSASEEAWMLATVDVRELEAEAWCRQVAELRRLQSAGLMAMGVADFV